MWTLDKPKASLSGPQEGVCNWCGQLGGSRIGKGVIMITCADPVPGRKKNTKRVCAVIGIRLPSCIVFVQINPIMNVIMMIPPKIITHKHHF